MRFGMMGMATMLAAATAGMAHGELESGKPWSVPIFAPYIPLQEAPIVLAQAATPSAGATPQPDYILKECQETESTGDPSSAMRTVDPAYMLKNYLYSSSSGKIIADLTAIKTTFLQGTRHGKITSVIDNTGRLWYAYDPTPDYIGNDRAVFLAEFEGKVYKIVVELHVFRTVGENSEYTTCPAPKLFKVNKPRSDLPLYGVSVTFVDLPGASLGQTTGATITLDTDAAGHGWYIININRGQTTVFRLREAYRHV